MAKTNALVHKFSVGEISTAGLARVDQDRTRLAAEIQENIFPHVIGKGQMRPGTAYLGASASNNRPKIIPFIKSVSDTALLELTTAKLRVWVGDALISRAAVTSTVGNSAFSVAGATITVTIASPAVVTWTAHGFSAGQAVTFRTTGALPTGMTVGTVYYVIATGLTANTFQFSTSAGGAAVNTSGSQSGTHTGDADWTLATTGSSTATIAGGLLTFNCTRGGTASCKQQVATSSTGTEHALSVVVTRGPVTFRCGSSEGGDEYIAEAELGAGTFSLAFTPTGSYWVQFSSRLERDIIVDSIAVEGSGTLEFTGPCTEAQLREIRHDQSGDIVFLAHASWQQRKIERYGTRSWALVLYQSDDGPFTIARTAKVRLKAAATRGNTTLTADGNFFKPEHVGALFYLTHKRFDATFVLGAEEQFTDVWRVAGIDAGANFNDRDWTYTVSGTWSGTLTCQRSATNEDTGFTKFRRAQGTGTTDITSNATFTNDDVTSGNAGDNTIAWFKIGFLAGAYTSGAATVAVSYDGFGGAGVCRVTGYTSATQVSVEVLSDFKNTTYTEDWREGAWSDQRGWPSALRFFDGRLWFGGLDKFWGSVSDNYYSFSLDVEGDSGSIQRALATGGTVNTVAWMLPLQRLIFGTDGAEISARSSSFDEPLTPTNLTLKDASTQGAAAVSPVKLDSRGLFVQRSGLRSYEIVYNADTFDYASRSLMTLNEDIGGTGIVGLAVQRQPEPYVWHVRADGQCPILLYDPAEQVAAWVRYIAGGTGAQVEDVAVLPGADQDYVYLAVKRTVNSATVRYIEKLAKHSEARGGSTSKIADAHVFNAGPVTTFSGLSHLIGETVVAWGNGKPLGSYTVNGSGQITLSESATNVCVGLGYDGKYKSAKLAYGAEGGSALLQKKRVGQIGLLLANTHMDAITFGPDFSTLDPMPRVEDGAALASNTVHSTYDETTFPFGGRWDTDSRVCLKISAPYSAELLGLVTAIETNEK